ncbi:MAG: DEAD/DEAH box helicase [Desulfurococcaceae archaeon]|nr:DEAD/DEAH box helicase [Desulfurococcaceae archaeon]
MSREGECPRQPVDIDLVPMPQKIKDLLRERYKYLTPPQAEAVSRGLFKNRNIIVSTPTASGKSLIAYMALMNVFLNGFKGIYTTPLKALATEKYEDLIDHFRGLGAKIGISTGDYDSPSEDLKRYDVLVTTYERLDAIMRQRPSWLRDIGAIVVDEIHVLGDDERGPVIEMILSRALKNSWQIIGLSATIGNPEDIGGWLNAETIECDWRPVPLIQGYYDKKKSKIFFENGSQEDVAGDLISHSVSKAVRDDYQILVFKQSRRDVENTASKIASEMSLLLSRYSGKTKELIDLLNENVSSRIERELLSKLFLRGVSFHHAGLSPEARKIIEKGFREKILRIVVATPTLAAGVNLPARRVIIYTHRYEKGYYEPISILEYKQMAGRAGRPQYDPYGEVVIADMDPETAVRYISSRPEDVYSALNNERALRIHILALLASGYAHDVNSIIDFMMNTFYSYKNMREILTKSFWKRSVGRILRLLSSYEMIIVKDDSYIEATRLGRLVSSLYIDPLTAVRTFDILRDSDTAGVDELFYLHLITLTPDFLRNITRRIKKEVLATEVYEMLDRGMIPLVPDDLDEDLYMTGYVYAKALNMWIEEYDEDSIMSKTNIQLGDLRVAIETATWISYALSKVLAETEFKRYSKIFDELSKRLETGVKRELLELVQLRGIGRVRARALYNHGVRNIEDLKRLSLSQILSIESIHKGVVKELCEQISDARFCREFSS